MRAFIASDNTSVSYQLRDTLRQLGHDCPPSRVVSLDGTTSRIASFSQTSRGEDVPELLLVVLSPDVERGLAALKDMHAKTSLPIFAVGSTGESKLVLRTLREGAREYLDEAEISGELAAALDRLETETGASPMRGRLVGVVPASGGCGSSTLAANLAVSVAKAAKDCILLDLNREAGDLTPLLDLKPSYTLADLCRSASRLDRGLLEGAFAAHPSGVRLLASPLRITDINEVTADGVRKILSLARDLTPFIVADLPRNFRPETIQTLEQADDVLLVTRLDFTSLRNARRFVEYLQDMGIEGDRLQVVVNRHRQPGELSVADAEGALGRKFSHYILDDPKTMNRANNNGVPAVLYAPSAKISGQITALASKLQESQSKSKR